MAGIAKSATTPAHMTTLLVRSHCPDQASTVGLIERFTVPSANHLAVTQPVQQTSRRSSTAKPPLPCPTAKRGKGETMQGFQAQQENCSPELQCIRYPPEIPVRLITLARASPMLHPTQDMTRTAKPPSSHDQTTDQAGTN